ncbi:hypothetical protein EPA93_17615 [Ktedonosporobacter rubrisoli]|uniref:Uncharacterized protein n=1 Tax=Ktedonosporobacter rubrisoli TaxID=2509675 RepID=A0A4V0YYX2_KTERU|nr:hypothetical protein [Ktedonosporobacter rubrisoli]QBD77711.1 hypothetical protein EPA93_17615 [Ktedonosporobacter rubrisoli]
MLQQSSPDLLSAMALLIIDTQKSEIYLIEHSEYTPAIFIHCRGKMPPLGKQFVNDHRIQAAMRQKSV